MQEIFITLPGSSTTPPLRFGVNSPEVAVIVLKLKGAGRGTYDVYRV